MSGNHVDPAAIHSRLTHPVIDSDGHWLEFGPTILEYMNKVGGTKAAEGLKSREEVVTRRTKYLLTKARNSAHVQEHRHKIEAANARTEHGQESAGPVDQEQLKPSVAKL